jgi:hypothetical protein
MKHLTRNERSPRLPVYWMNRDESRGRGREAQALSRPGKEVCKHARSSTYSGRALRRQVTAWQALELTSSFFPQISAAIPGPNMAFLLVPENLYAVFRRTEMKTNVVRLLENFRFPNDALRPELDTPMMAKARQDAG